MTIDKKELWDWGKALFIAFLLAFIVRSFLLSPIVVDGESMESTLEDQERMIVTKIGEPKRFDIVVFHATEEKDYIKRVIGLPGDRIEYKDDILYVNGIAYEEPYLDDQKASITDAPLTESFTLLDTPVKGETVPKGHVFVMGDNRRISDDSRDLGAIPMDQIVGTTNVVYWPLSEMRIIRK
ncbi:signal peptidase I [Bacillus tianshenii]|uniref:Signal peptidase I n=1 Tax=Sutcliffiella tianshenii TaxID=1463404 RepID=A0ABS2NZX8_9BACI|nr:signal peptidase I [Bacillus tianshenii]MBM7619952.1 signal peptidase I [Bacillus tianshenii]